MIVNVTLLCVIVLALSMMIRGYNQGMMKELSGLAALIAGLGVLALGIMLFSSFLDGEMTNTIYSVILLVLFGAAYGIVKFILRSAKAVSSLPILHFFDSVLGIVVGLCQAVVIVWIVFLLCAHNYLGPVTSYIQRDIADSTILKLLYEYNFFIR